MNAVVRSVNVGTPRDAAWAGDRSYVDRQAPASPGPVAGRPPGARGRPGLRHPAPRRGRPGGLRVRPRGPRRLGGRRSAARSATASSARTSPPRASTSTRPRSGSAGGSGPPLLEVASVRIPCNDFKSWMGRVRLRPHRLGQALRRARPPRPLPPGASRRACSRAGDADRRGAPARPRRHREHDVPRADHRADAAAGAAPRRRPGRRGAGGRREVRRSGSRCPQGLVHRWRIEPGLRCHAPPL